MPIASKINHTVMIILTLFFLSQAAILPIAAPSAESSGSETGFPIGTLSHDRPSLREDVSWASYQKITFDDAVWSLEVSPDGRYLAVGKKNGDLEIWNMVNWTLHHKKPNSETNHTWIVSSVSWSPDGSMLATTSYDKFTRVWNTTDWSETVNLTNHDWWITGSEFSPNGEFLVTCGNDFNVSISYTSNWSEVQHISYWKQRIEIGDVAFSPDGNYIAYSMYDGTIKVNETSTWTEVANISAHDNYAYKIAWSNDGKFLASTSAEGTVKVWDTSTWTLHKSLNDHLDITIDAAWNSDDSILATCSEDATVILWDTSSWEILDVLRSHTYKVFTLDWVESGDYLVSGSWDMSVIIWTRAAPVLELHMDEGSGSTVSDSSGNGMDGTLKGGTWVDGVSGSAIYFNGSTYLDTNRDLSWSWNESFSISLWFKLDNVFRKQVILGKKGPTNWEYRIATEDSGYASFAIYERENGIPFYFDTNEIISNHTWYNIVFRYNGMSKSGSLFLDGNEEKTLDAPGNEFMDRDANITIGDGYYSHGVDRAMTGTVDEVRIFNRALATSEIVDYYLQTDPYRPDLAIGASEIYLNNTRPDINDTVLISAQIWNHGDKPSSADVSFYDGDPDQGGVLIDVPQHVDVMAHDYESAYVEWKASAGSHSIHVDIGNVSTYELLTNNNNASIVVDVNDPPTANSFMSPVSFPEDTELANAVNLSSAFSDDDMLTFQFDGNDHVKISILGSEVTLGADVNWSGTETVYFLATDQNGLKATSALNVTVTPVNDPPVLVSLPDLSEVYQGVPLVMDMGSAIHDSDSGLEDLEVTTDCTYGSVSGLNVTLIYPRGVDCDDFNVTLSDGKDSTIYRFQINILDDPTINDPPFFLPHFPSKITVQGDIPYLWDIAPYIGDEDTPAGDLRVNSSSSMITIIGTVVMFDYPSNFGQENVTFSIFDGDSTVKRSITVIVDSVNDPPRIIPIPDQTGSAGVEWTLHITPYITDIDTPTGDLAIHIEGDGVSINGSYLQFFFLNEGRYTATLFVSDGEFEVSTPINITVEMDNIPPSVVIARPSDGDTYQLNESITMECTALDLDGSIDIIRWYSDGEFLGSGNGLEVSNQSLGDHDIRVVALDNSGLGGEDTVSITVAEGSGVSDKSGDDDDAAGNDIDGDPDHSKNKSNHLIPLVAGLSILAIIITFFATELGTYSGYSFINAFTRRKNVLDNDVRESILNYIQENPGTHYNIMKRNLDISNGTLAYHINVLVNEEYVRAKTTGMFKVFFPMEMRIPELGLYNWTSNQKRIFKHIKENPGIDQKKISKDLELARSSITMNIGKLKKSGLVKTNMKDDMMTYYAVSPETLLENNICPFCAEPFDPEHNGNGSCCPSCKLSFNNGEYGLDGREDDDSGGEDNDDDHDGAEEKDDSRSIVSEKKPKKRKRGKNVDVPDNVDGQGDLDPTK